MAAESLPFALEAVSSWELEAWYEDLQEVLSSDDNGGPYIPSPGNEEVSEDAGLKVGKQVWWCTPGVLALAECRQDARLMASLSLVRLSLACFQRRAK